MNQAQRCYYGADTTRLAIALPKPLCLAAFHCTGVCNTRRCAGEIGTLDRTRAVVAGSQAK
jgi:hypothetical protein